VKRALFLCVTALAGCEAQQRNACDLTVSAEIAFTDANAADVVTARTYGPDCARTIGVYTIATADGHPVWAWASPMPRAFGDAFAETEPAHMEEFLQQWASPEIIRTTAAPEWDALATGQTTLDRLTYDDIRARDLPMLCHFIGTGRQACVFWEPAAGGAGHYLDRDVAEEGTQ